MVTKWDKRIDKVEDLFGNTKVPLHERRTYVQWTAWDDETDPFVEEKERLLREYDTIEGTTFLKISWGEPEKKPVTAEGNT